MDIIPNTISAACVPLTAVFGSKIGNYVALSGTLLAIKWLLTRLDKAEQKADVRDQERDKNLQLIASMTVQNQAVIEQNSEVLSDVKQAIEKMTP